MLLVIQSGGGWLLRLGRWIWQRQVFSEADGEFAFGGEVYAGGDESGVEAKLQHGAELVEGVEIDHSIAAGAEPGVLPVLHAAGDALAAVILEDATGPGVVEAGLVVIADLVADGVSFEVGDEGEDVAAAFDLFLKAGGVAVTELAEDRVAEYGDERVFRRADFRDVDLGVGH